MARERHEQRLRIKRLGISALSHGMLLIILALALLLDLLNNFSIANFFFFTLSAMVSQATFWLLFHYRINLKLHDPSLTLLQITTTIAWFSLLISLLPEIRGSLTILYIMVMLFGIFQLSTLEFACAGLFSLVCFGGIIIADFHLRPEEVDLRFGLMQWVILASAQTWIALFANYVRRLSVRLKKQRHVLQHSNRKMRLANEELEQAMEQLDEIAGTDELTGILNRRRFFEESRLRLENAKQYQPSVLCIIDLDHFKQVNDRFGHQVGDSVLERFCQITRECLRGSDLFGRYGGEEFILLLPQTNQESGMQIAERIRHTFSQYTFDTIEEGLTFSVSIGITLHRYGETIEDTLNRADKALYKAKDSGRDQTVYISATDATAQQKNQSPHD